MLCPQCGSDKHKVIDTRQGEMAIIRVRRCDDCDHPWRTEEAPRETMDPEGGEVMQE